MEILGTLIVVLLIVGLLWYNTKNRIEAENTAAVADSQRQQAEAERDALEKQRAARQEAERAEDRDEASRITDPSDAVDFLRDSFPGSRR